MDWKTEQPRARLLKLIDRADFWIETIPGLEGGDVQWDVMLKADFNGRMRFNAGTYHMSAAGVRASATAGRLDALKAWRASAARKVAKMGRPEA